MSTSREQKVRVLSVDDSALMRSLLTALVDEQPDMTMVATAPDPLAARELIKKHDPDVLTLDVEMPHMDGLDFLERLMRLRPMPVVMISSLTERGSAITLQALETGAVDFVPKPAIDIRGGVAEAATAIADKIRAASRARLARSDNRAEAPVAEGATINPKRLFAIGASTGGVEALRELLIPMPADAPPALIVQHMPAGFTAPFARRLDASCRITVVEAADGQTLERGHAYIAPGGPAHMRVERVNDNLVIRLVEDEPVNRHRPAVDVLFHSIADTAGSDAIGVLLTGMGRDGADGLLKMRRAGADTVAQDEASSIVFGMPGAAIACGAATQTVALSKMASHLITLASTDAPVGTASASTGITAE